jgi:hypothetical protein
MAMLNKQMVGSNEVTEYLDDLFQRFWWWRHWNDGE